MLLQFVTMSWDDGFLGARASRPHQAWHSLGHLPHLDQPGTAPWLSFGLADAVPAHRVAASSIALKLSGGQRDRMRAGRPRSQAMPSRRCGGGVWRATSQKADVHPLGNSRLPASRVPAPHDGADHSRVKQVLFQASRAPALQCGSYESETTKLGNIDRQDEKPVRRKRSAPVRFLRSQPGGRRAGASFPVDRGGGVGPGCARTGAGGTPALPGGPPPTTLAP